MTDLLSLINNVPLSGCQKEIDSQFQSISNHENVMKLAVLASFFLKDSIDIIRQVDPKKFLESLRDELEKEVKEAQALSESRDMYMEHLEKNRELIAHFEARKAELQRISAELERLLKEYDNILGDMAVERCNKSIAEIEALL